jgi:UDP-glucose 4-epimerase
MKILITGGRGFVAGRLAEYLNSKSHQVKLVGRKRIDNHYRKKLSIYFINWNRDTSIKSNLKNIDVIIHTAGSNAEDAKKNPKKAKKFKQKSTSKLIYYAKKMKIRKIIYISSTHIYKKIDKKIAYKEAHLAAEKKLFEIGSNNELQCIILRVSNIIGAPIEKASACWTLLANDLCRQTISNKKMIIKSNKNENINFITMAEVSRVINLIIKDKNFKSGTYNLVSDTNKSIFQISKIIRFRCNKLYKYRPTIIKKFSKNFKYNIKISNHKIYKIFKKVKLNFEKEIDDLLKFCKKNINKKYEKNN